MDRHEVIYTPESHLRHPLRLWRTMFADLAASNELAWRLAARDISAQYRQTLLGYFWAVFPPLANSLIFVMLNASEIVRIPGTTIPYPAYAVMGTVFFGLFLDALHAPLKIATAAKVMLVRINFPREALLLSGIWQVLFAFAVKLVLLAGTLLLFRVPVKLTAVLAVVPLLGLLGIGTMIGILLTPLGLLFQDISYGLAVATSSLMLLTPVVYPPPDAGILATIMLYNPLTPLVLSARELVLEGPGMHLVPMLVVSAITAVLLLVGWSIFRLALPILIERMGA